MVAFRRFRAEKHLEPGESPILPPPPQGSNSDALPFGRLWYSEPSAVSNAIGYVKFYGCSHDALIRVYDAADNVIETHEHAGEFKEP
jgi:hypothetical protein